MVDFYSASTMPTYTGQQHHDRREMVRLDENDKSRYRHRCPLLYFNCFFSSGSRSKQTCLNGIATSNWQLLAA